MGLQFNNFDELTFADFGVYGEACSEILDLPVM